MDQTADDYTAFAFEGRWQDYAPIAFSNLLLTVVTLGFYRFWGKARTRRYLWSQTRFIDDHLHWSGTGLELFKGAMLAFALILLPFLALNLTSRSLALHGQILVAGLITLAQFVLLFFLIGVAGFRSLRYRLSRTYWRGIRGGSRDPGLAYGWAYVWKNAVGYLAFGLLLPRAMVSLWNQRWNAMSFGQYPFESGGRVDGLMRRYLLCYLAPLIGFLVGTLVIAAVAAGLVDMKAQAAGAATAVGMLMVFAIIIVVYLVVGLVLMGFYAKFFRQMVDGLSLHTLTFRFDAKTMDWLKLLLGDAALVALTLGIGAIFLDYRHWRFFIDHLEAFGEIAMDDIAQSTTPELKQGEGLLDAFDMGAL